MRLPHNPLPKDRSPPPELRLAPHERISAAHSNKNAAGASSTPAAAGHEKMVRLEITLVNVTFDHVVKDTRDI
jgi:hypothetical protein